MPELYFERFNRCSLPIPRVRKPLQHDKLKCRLELLDLPVRIVDYFLDIESFPRIPLHEENDYLRNITQGDRTAREILIKAKLRNIRPIVLKYSQHIFQIWPYLKQESTLWDLIGAASVGVIAAIDTFNAGQVSPLGTRIHNTVTRALRECTQNFAIDYSLTQQKLRDEINFPQITKKLWFYNHCNLKNKTWVLLHFNPASYKFDISISSSYPELAPAKEKTMYCEVHANISSAKKRAGIMARYDDKASYKLIATWNGFVKDKTNAPILYCGPTTMQRHNLDDLLTNSTQHYDSQIVALKSLLREELFLAVDQLSDREQQILIFRYGLYDVYQRTLKDLVRELNITRERVRQIETKALEKLKHPKRTAQLQKYRELIANVNY